MDMVHRRLTVWTLAAGVVASGCSGPMDLSVSAEQLTFGPLFQYIGSSTTLDSGQCGSGPAPVECQDSIRSRLLSYETLFLKRGQTYHIGEHIQVDAGKTLSATGTGPDPIIYTTSSFSDLHAIVIRASVTVEHIDLRGPYWSDGATNPVNYFYPDTTYGINGSSGPGFNYADGWKILNSKIRGFRTHGIHANGSENVEISGNIISSNKCSGINLWRDYMDGNYRGAGGTVRDNTIEDNGCIGIDVNQPSATIESNEIRRSGWNGTYAAAGDRSGIVLCTNVPNQGFYQGMSIVDNIIQNGYEHGILFTGGNCTTMVVGVTVNGNLISGNAEFGMRFDGTTSNVTFSNNIVSGGSCWNTAQGVMATNNACNYLLNVEITGPAQVYRDYGTSCTWSAIVSGGTPPYTYEWYRESQLVSTNSWYVVDTIGVWSGINLEVHVTDSAVSEGLDATVIAVTDNYDDAC